MKKTSVFGMLLSTLFCASMAACVAASPEGRDEQGADETSGEAEDVGSASEALTSCASCFGLRTIKWDATVMSDGRRLRIAPATSLSVRWSWPFSRTSG